MRNVDEPHTLNGINRITTLTEKGAEVNGGADSPGMHDILTGSTPDSRVAVSDKDTTCGNWTKSGKGAAIAGHHDRWGLRDDEPAHGIPPTPRAAAAKTACALRAARAFSTASRRIRASL